MTRRCIARLLMLALTFGSAVDGHASDAAASSPRLRASDLQMRLLIDEAISKSATVRALVEHLAASDVIVYVACEFDPSVRTAGRLNFMTAAGGVRYVVIRLKLRRRHAAIAMLAHELQHAAEIAGTPSIVDAESLAREYARMGYRSYGSHGFAFDTQAAVDVGRRVADELMTPDNRASLTSRRDR